MRRVFPLFSAGFALAAIFHVAALIAPGLGAPSPPWRHLLFAAINALAAAGMLVRPRVFVIAFAILCAQQLYSHGTALAVAWNEERRVDVASVIVLLAMPLALGLLVHDARKLKRARAGRTV